MLSSSRSPPGRPAGPSKKRDAILQAARALFADQGLDRASIRAIAARARVDPALVLHYFGSKQDLFEACLRPPIDGARVEAVVRGARSTVGRRVASFYVETIFREQAASAAALLRSALSDPQAAALLAAAVRQGPLAAIQHALGDAHAALRGELVASHMLGLFVVRHLLRLEPLASTPDAVLIELVAPTLQRYLIGPLPRRRP